MTSPVSRKTAAAVIHAKPAAPSASARATKLAQALTNASDPGHIANAANDAMKFLLGPDAKSLSLKQARALHVALGEGLTSLDAGAGWKAKAPQGPAGGIVAQLESDHPGEISNGVKAAMKYLQSPGAKAMDSGSRNELFKALGAAQTALQQVEAGL